MWFTISLLKQNANSKLFEIRFTIWTIWHFTKTQTIKAHSEFITNKCLLKWQFFSATVLKYKIANSLHRNKKEAPIVSYKTTFSLCKIKFNEIIRYNWNKRIISFRISFKILIFTNKILLCEFVLDRLFDNVNGKHKAHIAHKALTSCQFYKMSK